MESRHGSSQCVIRTTFEGRRLQGMKQKVQLERIIHNLFPNREAFTQLAH